jgi:hypothetical protein
MLNTEEANSILEIIGGIVNMPGCDSCERMATSVRRISKRIQDLTEKPDQKEFEITDRISENVKRYFKFKRSAPLKSTKIDLLDGEQWATNAQLEMRVNQLIEAVNELIDRVENKNVV